jgi:hypothetical protein
MRLKAVGAILRVPWREGPRVVGGFMRRWSLVTTMTLVPWLLAGLPRQRAG